MLLTNYDVVIIVEYSEGMDILLRMLVSGATSLLILVVLVYIIRHLRRQHLVIGVRRELNTFYSYFSAFLASAVCYWVLYISLRVI
jgi:hypothetical protein